MRLLRVVQSLRSEGMAKTDRLAEILESVDDAREVADLLVALKLATVSGETVCAKDSLRKPLGPTELTAVEEYVIGQAEAQDLRRLVGELMAGAQEGDASPKQHASKKTEVTEEVVRRYAKSFLDVSDITGKQKASEKGKVQ